MLGWRAMALLVFRRGTAVPCRLRTDTNASSNRNAPNVATCGTGRNACATQTVITYREYVTHRTAPRDLAHEIIARSLVTRVIRARDRGLFLRLASGRAHVPSESLFALRAQPKFKNAGRRPAVRKSHVAIRVAHTQRLCHPERSEGSQLRAILRVAMGNRVAIRVRGVRVTIHPAPPRKNRRHLPLPRRLRPPHRRSLHRRPDG